MREGIDHADWPSVVIRSLLDIEDCQLIHQPVIGTVILDEFAKFLFDSAESVRQVRLRKIRVHRDGVQADLDTKVCNRGHKALRTFLEKAMMLGNCVDDIVNIHPARNGHLTRPIHIMRSFAPIIIRVAAIRTTIWRSAPSAPRSLETFKAPTTAIVTFTASSLVAAPASASATPAAAAAAATVAVLSATAATRYAITATACATTARAPIATTTALVGTAAPVSPVLLALILPVALPILPPLFPSTAISAGFGLLAWRWIIIQVTTTTLGIAVRG